MERRVVACQGCGRPLTNDEIALAIKLCGLQAPVLLCLSCHAEELGETREELEEMVAFFKLSGCVHFHRDYLS